LTGTDAGPIEWSDDDKLVRRLTTPFHWSLRKVVVAIAAFAFLGGSVGYLIGTPRAPGADSVDVGFLHDMIDHHEQAVQISLMALADDGIAPITRTFAQETIIFQQRQLGTMDAWLEAWGYTAGDLDRMAMQWMGVGVPVAQMPGMQSADAMGRLKTARGSDADKLFLTMMRDHHRGGIHMADDAATHAGAAKVRTFAAQIASLQRSEVNEYTIALQKLGLE
jgi:uncharacterized protein (DUF305 family)